MTSATGADTLGVDLRTWNMTGYIHSSPTPPGSGEDVKLYSCPHAKVYDYSPPSCDECGKPMELQAEAHPE